jgi:hypothetical protein
MKKVGVFVSVLFLSVSLFSCANLTPNGGGGENAVEINVSDLPELAIPLSPAEAEAAYADAQVFMDQKVMVPYDDAHPDLYYVMMFVTNSVDMKNLLTYYIPYSVFPMPGYETNEALLVYGQNVGAFTGGEYTNVFPFYALITAAHYNYFLSTNIFIFKPIRQITYTELSNLGGFDNSFIENYNTKISYMGLTNTTKWWPWEPQFWEAIWGNLCDASGYIGDALAPKVNCNFYCTYTYYDNILGKDVTKTFPPNVFLKLHKSFESGPADLASKPAETGSDGYARQYLNKNQWYVVIMDNVTPYAYNFKWNITLARIFIGNHDNTYHIECPKSNNPNYGFMYGNIYGLWSFAKSEGLSPGAVLIEVKEITEDGVAGLGGIGGITIDSDYQYNLEIISHEYGHYLHHLKLGYDPAWKYNGMIPYPDGTLDKIYYNNNNCFIGEGWAEFFAVAFLIKKYGKVASESNELCKLLEANIGSKEVMYVSDKSNGNVIGKNGDYLYRYGFPRYYKEASILYDLWDKNEYQNYFNTVFYISSTMYGHAEFWITLIGATFYPGTQFTNGFYNAYIFDKVKVIDRENKYDQSVLPLSKILEIVVYANQHDNTSLENILLFYPYQESIMKSVVEMHSPDYPLYVPGIAPTNINLKGTVNPNGTITLSWNYCGSLMEYRIYQYINGVMHNEGSFVGSNTNFMYEKVTITYVNYPPYTLTNYTFFKPNTPYVYSMKIKCGDSESVESALVTNIIPIPLAPSGFQTTELNSIRVSMKWNAVPGALKYVIQKISSNMTSGTKTSNNINVTGTEYTDNSIVSGTRYIYKICSQNYAGKGTNSATVIDISLSGPQIVLYTPTNNSTNGYNNVYFSGSALSDGDHPATNVYIKFDGGAYTSVSVDTNGEWSKLCSFGSKGNHTVYYYCVDENGMSSMECVMPFYVNKMYVISVLSTVGSKGIGDGQFSNTIFSMALDSSGYTYVVDHDSFRVEKFLLNDSVGTYVTKWGSKGTADTQFGEYQGHGPKGIVYSSLSNRVIVADVVNCYMKFFDTSGVYKGKWYWPYASGYLGKMAVGGNYLYVTDFFSGGKVTIFTLKGSKVGVLGTGKLSSSGQGIASYGDKVYIADIGYSKIMVFSTNGTFISEFGSYGTNLGQFKNPRGIDADAKYIYVADTGNNRIQIFDHYFNSVASFNFANSFASPTDIKVKYLSGSTGYLFVLEQGSYCIKKLLIDY